MVDRERIPGIVCPFHAAMANPANEATKPGAPKAIVPGQRNGLWQVYRFSRVHAGFSAPFSLLVVAVAILGARGITGALRNFFTFSFDSLELQGSLLDKHPQNSGLLRQAGHGNYEESRLESLLTEYGGRYTPMGGNVEGRGMSKRDFDRYNDEAASKSKRGSLVRAIHRTLADFELPLALGAYGTRSEQGFLYFSEDALRTFFERQLFPHADVVASGDGD